MRELDDRNPLDVSIKKEVCEFCRCPKRVLWKRTPEQDMALVPCSRIDVLDGILAHVSGGKPVYTDVMDNGNTAYIFKACLVAQHELYVKVKFAFSGQERRMVVFAAHPDRRW